VANRFLAGTVEEMLMLVMNASKICQINGRKSETHHQGQVQSVQGGVEG